VYVRLADPDSNAVANSGVVVLDTSILVFDTHFTPEAGEELRAKIGAVSSKQVRYVVNSHFHPDHTHGNQAFPAAHIIASASARRSMLQTDLPAMNRTLATAQAQLEKLQKAAKQEAGSGARGAMNEQIAARQQLINQLSRQRVVPPSLTANASLRIVEGAREVVLLSPGAGHTEGDLVMFLPAEKLVFTGDVFFNRALPSTQDANLLEWVKALESLLKLKADRFVPGHGAVGTRKDVQEFLDYLKALRELVQPAVERGDSLEQALRDSKLPARYSGYSFTNFFPANVQKMYLELKRLQPAVPPGRQ
jgi:glyoxylase-like metal-dependent hydrolase (beta-lactamase superfamily II)